MMELLPILRSQGDRSGVHPTDNLRKDLGDI